MPPPLMFFWEIEEFFTGAKAVLEVFCKNDVLKNFTIFTEKCLC